ncbi:MAG: DUF4290 domain-containing protein [Saprospiraceae bacterium]
MNNLNMEYNSDRDRLVIPEYGRNVQELVKHAKNIENPELRQAFAEKVVDLMMQMHPQNRNVEDYREKLWKHVFQIAEYDIDIMPPSGELPQPGDEMLRPKPIGYPTSDPRFRHYGDNVRKLIMKAIEMEDGPIKDGFVDVIGSYMKLAYRTWNQEHYVSDDLIKEDLKSLSKGKLELREDSTIDNLTNSNRRKKRSNHKDDNNDRRNNNRGRGGKRGGRRR